MYNDCTRCNYWTNKVDEVQRALRRSNGPSEKLLYQAFQVSVSENVYHLREQLYSCNECYGDMEGWRERYLKMCNTIKALKVYP
jgi:hypothetical protein